MAELETHDQETPHGSARSSSVGRPTGRHVEHESITLGAEAAGARRENGEGATDDIVTLGGRSGRQFGDAARRMLTNIDKHGTVDDTPPTETVDTDVNHQTETVQGGTAQPAATPTEPPKPAEQPAAADEHRATAERLTKRNQELVAELERLKATPSKGREPSAREKALDEIERGYLDDPIGAIRRLQALALGIEDPKHADVDTEMRGVYQDLTARELGVSLDEAKQASREAARTRQLLAREKRERTAEQQKPATPPQADETAQIHSLIGNELSLKRSDGKSIAERHPLMAEFALDLTGSKPEALIWDEVRRGIASGELRQDMPNDQLIEAGAKRIETRYQALADRFGKARSPASTAQPTPAAEVKANNERDNSHGPRTITNASASVAPATPPATKPEQKAPEQKPTYRNEKERRAVLARKYAGDA